MPQYPHHEFQPDMESYEDSIARAKAAQARDRAQIVALFPTLARYFTDADHLEQLRTLDAMAERRKSL